MYYSYIEIDYVATSFSPARTDLALKLLTCFSELIFKRILLSEYVYPFDLFRIEPLIVHSYLNDVVLI